MFIARGSVFLTSSVRKTVNNELRRTVKKEILAYFVLMIWRSTSGKYSGYSDPRGWIVGRFPLTYM